MVPVEGGRGEKGGGERVEEGRGESGTARMRETRT